MRKKIFILLLVLVILVFAGCANSTSKKSDVVSKKVAIQEAAATSNLKEPLSDSKKTEFENADDKELAFCQNKVNDYVRKSCYKYLALKYHISDYCIKDDGSCFESLAYLMKNEKLCEKLSAELNKEWGAQVSARDLCLRGVATKGINIKVCDKISDIRIVQQCKELLSQAIDCSISNYTDACYVQQATSELKVDKCEKIDSPSIQKICKDQVNSFSAVYTNSMIDCNLVEDISLKNNCIKELAILNNDNGLCTQTSENYQNTCYLTFALGRSDLESCNNIIPRGKITKLQAEQERDQCFILLALGRTMGDIPCKYVMNQERKESCIKELRDTNPLVRVATP